MLGNGKRAPSSLCVTLQPTQLPVYHQNTSTRGYDQGVSCWSEYLAISAQLGAPDRHWRGVSSPDDVPECSVGSNPSGTSTLSSQGVVHPFDERSCTGIHLVLKEIQLRALEMVMCGRRRLVLRIGQPFNSTVPSPRVKRITCQLSPTHAKARSYTKGKTFEEACKGASSSLYNGFPSARCHRCTAHRPQLGQPHGLPDRQQCRHSLPIDLCPGICHR